MPRAIWRSNSGDLSAIACPASIAGIVTCIMIVNGDMEADFQSESHTMRRKNLGSSTCPVARSLERVGEWWSILILRDALLGLRRFDEFEQSLGIAPNMLTRRLKGLVESGMLERVPYQDRPVRYEYVPTAAGRDFRPVLWSLIAWGNRHFAPEGRSVILQDTRTGQEADPMLVDRRSGEELMPPRFRAAAGPAAPERTRLKYGRQRNETETAS